MTQIQDIYVEFETGSILLPLLKRSVELAKLVRSKSIAETRSVVTNLTCLTATYVIIDHWDQSRQNKQDTCSQGQRKLPTHGVRLPVNSERPARTSAHGRAAQGRSGALCPALWAPDLRKPRACPHAASHPRVHAKLVASPKDGHCDRLAHPPDAPAPSSGSSFSLRNYFITPERAPSGPPMCSDNVAFLPLTECIYLW